MILAAFLNPVDITVILVYLLGVVALGLWAGTRGGRAKATHGAPTEDSNSYFLAGGTLRWPVIGMALFATNISCVHLVSLAQSGFDTGLLKGNFEWMAAFTLVLLALFFAPFYIKVRIATLPDYLERRYDRACRDWLAVLSIVSAVIIHVGFSFLTGGLVLGYLFPGLGGIQSAIIVIALLTGLYTIVGGLLAVVLTETVQTVVLLVGAAVITGAAWMKLGGWGPLVEILQSGGHMDKLSMLRPAGDPSGMPWYSILLGYPVLGIWYWCADQTIVQRVLGARDENHARVGSLFCALLKILPVFLFVLPGLLAFALYEKNALDLSSLTTDGKLDSKNLYSAMIVQLLPAGLRGLIVAALLAALMSTVAGALNSISSLVSLDLYQRFHPAAGERRLVFVGRIAAAVALVAAIALIPLLNRYSSLFDGINAIIAHIAPPVTTVFLLGVFWPRATALSGRLTLWLGSALGVGVFLLNTLVPDQPLAAIPFMMMAFYLFLVCAGIQVAVTLARPATAAESARSAALCWKSPLEPLRSPGWPGIGNYKLLSLLVIAAMVALYAAFR
jgi:SSS family solute:Na+ symporter